MMTSVQTQMNQKADQLFKDVVFKFSRTYVWPATTGAAGAVGALGVVDNDSVAVITPFSGPPSPRADRYGTPDDTAAGDGHRDGEKEDLPVGTEEAAFPGSQGWLDSFVESFDADSLDLPFFKNGQVDLEACLEGVMGNEIPDSAYGTLPTSEGHQHGSYGLGTGQGMGMGMGMAGMVGLTGFMGSNLEAWMR